MKFRKKKLRFIRNNILEIKDKYFGIKIRTYSKHEGKHILKCMSKIFKRNMFGLRCKSNLLRFETGVLFI